LGHERFEGYRRGLRETGMDVDDRLVFQAGSTIEDGVKAALQMANEKSDATAIQAVNDLVAIGCASMMLNQRIRIPQDLSIAGFGNVLIAEHFRVPLTTVRQPKFRLGTAAVDAMMPARGKRAELKRLPARTDRARAPPSAGQLTWLPPFFRLLGCLVSALLRRAMMKILFGIGVFTVVFGVVWASRAWTSLRVMPARPNSMTWKTLIGLQVLRARWRFIPLEQCRCRQGPPG
jgi:hypothetical protein